MGAGAGSRVKVRLKCRVLLGAVRPRDVARLVIRRRRLAAAFLG